MSKLILFVSAFLFLGCDKRMDISLNGNTAQEKLIITDCGAMRLSFSTMGGTYILSCFIDVPQPTKVSADCLSILVNDTAMSYNLWVNNERSKSFNISAEKNIKLGYSFVVPRELGTKLEFKIFASEQFLQPSQSKSCGFSPIIKIVNR